MLLLTHPVSLQLNNFYAQLEDLKLTDPDIYDRIPVRSRLDRTTPTRSTDTHTCARRTSCRGP